MAWTMEQRSWFPGGMLHWALVDENGTVRCRGTKGECQSFQRAHDPAEADRLTPLGKDFLARIEASGDWWTEDARRDMALRPCDVTKTIRDLHRRGFIAVRRDGDGAYGRTEKGRAL